MKVAQILYSGLGGHGSVVFSLVEAGGARWSHALGFLGIEPLLAEYRSRCEENGIAWRYFRAEAGRPRAQWGAVYRWLDAERPDAIVNHSATAIPPCAAYARLRRIPFIHVEHTAVAAKSRQEWLASRMAMVLADRVVMLTEQYRELSAERLGRWMRPGKVTIIPNGLDTDRWRPAWRANADAGTVRIGMAARFSPGKRFDLLIRAVAALAASDPARRWRLTIAGDGPTRPEVAAIAERTAPGLVTFAGLLDEEALIEWMQSLDIYVHASAGETLSTALLQAMACEVPIVASRVNGIVELVAPDRGLLAANGELGQWTAALARLAGDAALQEQLTGAARALVEHEYRAEQMFASYNALVAPAPATSR